MQIIVTFFLVPPPLVKHQKYETVMIIRFFENSFLSKKRHDYSFSLSPEKHKTVMIICTVMIQGAFFFYKEITIAGRVPRVSLHPWCIRGLYTFYSVSWATQKKVKWTSTHRHSKICVFVPQCIIWNGPFWKGSHTHSEICSSIGIGGNRGQYFFSSGFFLSQLNFRRKVPLKIQNWLQRIGW